MKKYCYFLLIVALYISCKKDKPTPVHTVTKAPKVTSAEYIDSLLFVNTNNYQIATDSAVASFSCSDSHIQMSSSGLITRLTSAEVVPITITWKNPKLGTTTIYALGAMDTNQDYPFKSYQGALATDAYASYLQGWKTLQKLPVAGETYAIVLRHADASCGADFSQVHNYPGPLFWWKSTDSTLARQLNAQGIQRATILGQVFKDLKFPIKRVITSEFYRAIQTGILMNMGPTATQDQRINHPSHNLYSLYSGMTQIIGEQPIDNQMTLIIAHHPINELQAITGYPSFPAVSPFNWTGAYLIKVETDGTITYEGAASYGMFKCWRDIKVGVKN
jgi:phosphohistidine phosphatase SixA